MGSGANIGSGKAEGKKKLKSKFDLNSLDLFFSSKLDLEDLPFISASDIDKVLECQDEETNKTASAFPLNTLVIKETKIDDENKSSFIRHIKESTAKAIRKEKKVTSLQKNIAHVKSEVLRKDAIMEEVHRKSENKTLTGSDTKTERHKKSCKGRKRNASVEIVSERRPSEGPSRKYTRKRKTKSAENLILKENIEPSHLDNGKKSSRVRKTKSDTFNERAALRKRSWSMKQSDEEHSHSETKNSSQNDQMNIPQQLELETSHVTAKPGTLKYLKQRQNLKETLANESKAEDDFFSNPEALIAQNMAIYDDSDDSLTVKTPVGKAIRRNIPPNITPRTALIGQHCAITPTALKKESPKPFTKDKNCVLHEIYHLQELKKKKRKGKKGKEADAEEEQLKSKLYVTPLEFPRFEDKQIDEEACDDYFDDSV